MATYRTLIGNKTFLRVQQRAREISSVSLKEVKYYGRELVFVVPSASGSGTYETRVMVEDLDRRKTGGMQPAEINAIIRNSNLRVSCNCPAYTYWGFKYISTKDGYGLTVESRYPAIRNPKLRGYVCKHLYSALQVYPFITNEIRQALVR